MLIYHTTSVFHVSTLKSMNLPTYTVNFRHRHPPIICQATGRVIKPKNSYIRPSPPSEPPPFHILPCMPIVHPIQPPIVLLVHVVLKNKSEREKKPHPHKVSFETPSDTSTLLCEPIPEIPIPEIPSEPVPKNTFLEHTHLECSGNCSRHPLMTPTVYKMLNGHRGWGDMMYEEEEKRLKKIDRF